MSSFDTIASEITSSQSPLIKLIDEGHGNRHVGFTIHSSYSEMVVMTNDKWRADAGGLPMNGYLLATSLNPQKFSQSNVLDRRVIVFRVIGRSEIGTDRETIKAITRHFQDNPDTTDPSLDKME